MRASIAAICAALWVCGGADARPYEAIMNEAQAAFTAADYSSAAALLDEAQVQRPYSLHLTRNRVLSRILAGRMDEAIAIAGEIADRGLVLETPPHEAFDQLKAEPRFAPVAARMAANAKPKGDAVVVFENEDTELLPEAIARCPSGEILIGSVRTGAVLTFGANGASEIARLDGGVFDIECGEKTFQAVVNNQLAFEKAGEREAEAVLVTIERATGETITRESVADADALLGDLEIAELRAYASDSLTPRIFVQDSDFVPRVLATDPRFVNLQGLAYDEKRRRLFVADYLAGLFVVDVMTGEATQIANPSNAHLGGVDGLYLHKGDLIGVQNGTTPQRIVRIDLDRSGKVAKKLVVIQQALPEWNEPTHGFVDGGEFIYIATSNWPAYDDDGKLREGATPAPLRVMSAPLN